MRRNRTVAARGAGPRDPQQAAEEQGNFTPATAPQRLSARAEDDEYSLPESSGSRFALRNWRVPTRLIAIAIVPVVAGLIFAGLRVNSSVDYARQADEAERVAILARSATSLADALQNERDATALPLTRGDRDSVQVQQVWTRTDRVLAQFRADAARVRDNARVSTRVAAAETNLVWIESLRRVAYQPDMMPLATQQAYSEMWRPLLAFVNELGFGSTKVTSRGRSVYAVTLAKASSSTQRALVQTALARDQLTPYDPVAVQAAVTLEQIAYGEFLSAALPEDVGIFQRTMASTNEQRHDAYLVRVLGVKPGKSLSGAGLAPDEWYRLSSTEINLMRKVELDITNGIVAEAQAIRSDAERDAVINGLAAILAVAIAAFLTIVISRSMLRGTQALRNSALDIAGNRLPELVDKLSKTDPERVDTRVKPIPLFGRDELGQVARAFDQVHSEAVRLASEQALLRGNVNAIFTNLSRRNQGLIQRQLTLITELENNEAEPEQLEHLFKLDHLATRMRRNGENLLVLAGEDPGRRWTEPVPLVDILRAAASEVEQYARVELVGIPETDIHGTAVSDLVHLLAELLENATSFSSPQTKVRVTGTRLPDGRVMIEIHDKGIGLTPEDFADINHKLAHPPTVDVSIARRMGLFVVGRLSLRHGIRVQLRPSGESAGTTSLVMLPEPITHGGTAPEPAADDFEATSAVPGDERSYEEGRRSAAEFGFDDSRYDAPASQVPVLDAVGRSLQRQERLAALEAAGVTGSAETAQEPSERTAEQPRVDGPVAGTDAYQADGHPAGDYPAGDYPTGDYAAPDGYRQDEAAYEGYSEERGYGGTNGFADPRPNGQSPYSANGTGPATGEYTPDGTYSADGSNGVAGTGGYGGGFDAFADDGHRSSRLGHGSYQGGDAYGEHGVGEQGYGQAEYDSRGYPSGYTEPNYDGQRPYPDTAGDFAPPAADDGGPGMPSKDGFVNGEFSFSPDTESVSFTENGLPRRQPQWQRPNAEEPTGSDGLPQNADETCDVDNTEWQSANDSTWLRATQVRRPQAGGVTSSGLPRRVPKANLVPGTAEQTPRGGPQVSRAPDEVRGRLTNLRRGVQRGRNVGSETNGQGYGPDDQER